VHLLDSVGLRNVVDRYLIDISHVKPIWSNLFMAWVVNHLFGPLQVPFTLLITPMLHHRLDPYMPSFLNRLQEVLRERVAYYSGDDDASASTTTAASSATNTSNTTTPKKD
jgi:hypothetical protein